MVGVAERLHALRRFFEVDGHYVTGAALKALADEGSIEVTRVLEAIARIEPGVSEVLLAGGERLGYDRLLLATGAEPRPLSVRAGGRRGGEGSSVGHHPEGGIGDAVLEVFADDPSRPLIVTLAVSEMPKS